VGCAGSYPGPHSPASCYLVECEDGNRVWRILVDLGNGALGALQRYCDPLELDAVFLSHLHPDHCLDMCGYFVLRKYHPLGHQGQVGVYGPTGVAGRLARAYDIPEDPGMTKEFQFTELTELAGQPLNIGPYVVTAIPVVHPVEAFGFRITAAGKTLAYTGDTGACNNLEVLAAQADLLLAEASYLGGKNNKEGIHLTGGQAGAVAEAAGAKQLVLTHIPAWHHPATMLAEASETFAGPISLAEAGAYYLLS
jgi:ribonuclease BN (tRNA processing enzyme)